MHRTASMHATVCKIQSCRYINKQYDCIAYTGTNFCGWRVWNLYETVNISQRNDSSHTVDSQCECQDVSSGFLLNLIRNLTTGINNTGRLKYRISAANPVWMLLGWFDCWNTCWNIARVFISPVSSSGVFEQEASIEIRIEIRRNLFTSRASHILSEMQHYVIF